MKMGFIYTNKTGYRTAAQQLSEMSDTSLLDEYYLGRRSIFFVQDVKTEIDNRLSKINIHELRDFINSPSCTDWPLELLYEEMTNRATKSNSAVQPSFDPEQALIQLVQLCSFDKHILFRPKKTFQVLMHGLSKQKPNKNNSNNKPFPN